MPRIATSPTPAFPLQIVVFDDRPAGAARCAARLHAAGYTCRIHHAENFAAFCDRLREGPCDVILCADAMADGRRALETARQEKRPAPFLFFVRPGMGKRPSLRRRLEMIRAGAGDYLSSGEWDRLPMAVEQALQAARREADVRQAERGKLAAAQKLQALIDHHQDALLLIQPVTGTILRASRALGPLLGYAEEELVGRHFSVLFPPETATAETLDRLRVRGPVFAGQLFRRADGAVRPLDVTAALIPWGQTEAILTTLRDALPRQTLERDLFWSGTVAERCQDLALWAEADGRICQVNETLCRRLGYRREEMIGRPLAEIDPGCGAGLWPLHWEEVKTRGHFRLATRLRRQDGNFLPVEALIHHLAHDGREYQCLLARETGALERGAEEALDARETAA